MMDSDKSMHEKKKKNRAKYAWPGPPGAAQIGGYI